MKSTFKFGAYILAFLIILFAGIECFLFSLLFFVADIPIGFLIVVNLFFIFSWVWLVFGELRTKVIRVEIGYDHFVAKGYFGFGAAKTYYFNQIEGYRISILPSTTDIYEYLYVIAAGKKVIKLSQFYHRNYTALKDAINDAKISYLGVEDFSYARELKEIFI